MSARGDMDVAERPERDVLSAADLLDLTYDAVLLRDFYTDTIQLWNRGAEELYGFSRQEALGRVSHDLLQTIHPIPVEQSKDILVQTGRWEGELVHTARDGRRIVVMSRWAVRREAGTPVAILETNTDITERKEAEEALAFLAEASNVLASSLDYETTLASVARLAVPRIADWCAIHLVDEEGQVRQITVVHPDPARVELARELERRYPYDPDAPMGVPEVLRTGRSELVSDIPDDLLEAVSPDPELLQVLRDLGLESSMVVPLTARGHALGAISFVAAESGRHFGADDLALAQELAHRAGLAVDNARLHREAQRVAAERSAILAQMADGVILCDLAGTVTFMNEAARRLYGLDFTGSSLADYSLESSLLDAAGAPYEPGALPLERALVHGETTIDAEARIRRPDGSEVVIRRSATPITADYGTQLGAVLTVQDITAERDLERQKDQFLASVAHDLKTPLTSMKGLAQVLHRRLARGRITEPEQVLDGLERIDQAATRMTALVDQLLDVTRLRMGRALDLNRRETDLVALLRQEVAEIAETSAQHRIALQTSLPELVGWWDPARLERVFANLLSNAVKYSPQGGAVVVSVSRGEDTTGEWAVITITDQGLGIPAEDLPHIFERFHRGRNVPSGIQGTGIGLTGARQIVEQHGGTIEVTSTEGRGSTFTVRLPLRVDAAAQERL